MQDREATEVVSLADEDEPADRDDDEPCEVFEVDVLECNLEAVAAFRLCQLDVAATMAGLYWLGISPIQIRSALLLLRIKRSRWDDLADDVNYMGSVVANARNAAKPRPPRRT